MIPSTLVPFSTWYQKMRSDYEIFSNEYMPKSADNLLESNLNQTYA
jgi:hypothetical protein